MVAFSIDKCEERRIMDTSDAKTRVFKGGIVRLKVDIPFVQDEEARFKAFMSMRGAKNGPFFRQLVLTLMDESTGPIIEAAMRGRPIPDLSSGQAQELAQAMEARR